MSRLLIAIVVIAVVLTVYAVIDCAMTEARRTRALSKPVWLLVVLVVPVVGPILWILFGKGLLLSNPSVAPSAPDDDESFLRSLAQDTAHDERIRQLEEELRALDEQLAAGEPPTATHERVVDLERPAVADDASARDADSTAGGADAGAHDRNGETTADGSSQIVEGDDDAAPSTNNATRRGDSAGSSYDDIDDDRPTPGNGRA